MTRACRRVATAKNQSASAWATTPFSSSSPARPTFSPRPACTTHHLRLLQPPAPTCRRTSTARHQPSQALEATSSPLPPCLTATSLISNLTTTTPRPSTQHWPVANTSRTWHHITTTTTTTPARYSRRGEVSTDRSPHLAAMSDWSHLSACGTRRRALFTQRHSAKMQPARSASSLVSSISTGNRDVLQIPLCRRTRPPV